MEWGWRKTTFSRTTWIWSSLTYITFYFRLVFVFVLFFVLFSCNLIEYFTNINITTWHFKLVDTYRYVVLWNQIFYDLKNQLNFLLSCSHSLKMSTHLRWCRQRSTSLHTTENVWMQRVGDRTQWRVMEDT